MWSSSVDASIEDVESVRNYLQPQDRVTRALMSDRISSRHHRAEYTCEWAGKRLADFARSKDDAILVTGKEYCGKSVLAGWFVDRMRNTKGRLAHDVVFFSVDTALKEQMTSVAVVKSLVLQVFEKNAGNTALYKTIMSAVAMSDAGRPVHDVEDALWSALDVAMAQSQPTMFIVDGIDSVGQDSDILERIQRLASTNTAVKAIALSRPLTKREPKNMKTWSIEPEQTKVDIAHFVRERLASNRVLQSMQEEQKSTIVEKIAGSSQGSFTWSDLVIEIIKTEKSFASITKSLDSMPKTVKEVITRLVSTVSLTSRDTKQVLAWMIASQRPLLLTEIKQLFEIDFDSMTRSERFTDVEQDIRHACGGLVDITDGIVRFRSLAIRGHLTELAGSVDGFNNKDDKFPFNTKEANYDLCLRLLAYVKLVVDHQVPLSTTMITQERIGHLFDEYSLLEYACRYWITQFKQSPMYDTSGKHKITSGLKNAMPNTTLHPLLETACIRSQYTLIEVYNLEQLSLGLRKSVLGDQTEVVLQNLINVAVVRQHLTSIKEENTFFYEAWKISHTILSEHSEITVTCARNYIDSVTTFTKKSTELEEVLRYFIEYQKTTYGLSDKRTIFYLRRLADYCVVSKQETLAATLYRQIYDIMVSQYGSHSTETEEVYTHLKKVSTKEELHTITQQHNKSVEKNVAVTDTRRTTTNRELVQQYESENNIVKAEETMVNYWREISEASRTSKDVKVQEKQVDATFEYVDFLKRQKRTEEATTILNGLYLELEKNTSFTQSRVGWIERIASQMKQMGSVSSARSVYSSLWSYYRSSGQQNTKEAQSIARSLTETSVSSVETSTTTESQEEILREILETSTITSETVDITTVKTCWQLVTIYLRQEKHEEIIEICRDMLQRIWPTVLTGQKDVKLPKHYTTECVQIAYQLAKSYFAQHSVEETSQVYYSIFQACRSSPKQHEKELMTSARTLITHYQSIYRYSDALKVYEALYEVLVQVHGVTHREAIEIAYEKADLELKQNRRKEAESSYERIYTSLMGKNEFCHKDGIRAALSLCKMYEKQQKWEQARTVYHVLWVTFLRKGQEYGLGEEYVNQIFDRYLFILENKTTTDYKTLRGLATEYRGACTKLYGADCERTLTASMRLAELDEKEEAHQEEAISIYESVLTSHQSSKKIAAASTFVMIATAKQRLAHLYSARGITHDRAQNLYLEEYEASKNKYGYSHSQTISWLKLLITCYKKRNTTESTKTASTTLQDIITHIILTEKDSPRLYESSQSLAHIYVSQHITEPSAADFVAELRRHVVSGESTIPQLKDKTTERRAYTFVVGFEETTRGLEGSGQFSVLMSELMSESLLTQAYLKAKKSNAGFDVVFGAGARLRQFLRTHDRKDATRVEGELLEIFTQKIVGKHQADAAAIRQFFDIVVVEHGKDQQDITVLQTASEAILRSFNENQFQRGLSLSILADAYMHHYDGFRSSLKVEIAFRICLYLTGHSTKTCPDAKLKASMLHFSSSLLKEVLTAAQAIHLNILSLPIDELNMLVALLGTQHNYEHLEWLLADLWTARHTLSWPASTIALLGRRLVECRFSMGLRDSAIALAEDMVYNLRRVWGPLDKTTLELSCLLAEMYTAVGQHGKTMGVHEDILGQITSDEIDLDAVPAEEEAEIAARHVDLLKHAYARNNGWPAEKDAVVYSDLFSAVEGQVGKEKAWTTASSQGSVQPVEKWVTMQKGFKEDGVGMWRPIGGEMGWRFTNETESKRKHVNAMRRVSAKLTGDWANGDFGRSRSSTTTTTVTTSG
jgi:hypothetical protein